MEDGIKNSPVCLLSEYSGSRIRFQYPNPSHSVEHPLKHNTCSYTQSRIAAFSKYFRVLLNTHSYISNAYSSDCNESTGVFKTRNKRKPTNRRRVRDGGGGGTAKYEDCLWNVMAHVQKPNFVFRRNRRVHLKWEGRHFSRLLAAEVCASAVVMLDTPCSEVVWRVLATHSIRQFPLHFPSRVSPCAITFQLDSNKH
jgi:hypothetical protein